MISLLAAAALPPRPAVCPGHQLYHLFLSPAASLVTARLRLMLWQIPVCNSDIHRSFAQLFNFLKVLSVTRGGHSRLYSSAYCVQYAAAMPQP